MQVYKAVEELVDPDRKMLSIYEYMTIKREIPYRMR